MTTIAIHEADGQRVTFQTEIAYSLVTGGASPAKDTHAYYLFMKNQITLTEKRFFEWHEDNVSVTLRNKGGSYGGGRSVDYLLYQSTVGALQAVDYKGPNRQYVEADKLIIEIWN